METLKIHGLTFELVKKIPGGYDIWHIGKNMLDGYLPLCQCDVDHNVNTNTLKAIKCADSQTIMRWCALAPTKKEYEIRFRKIIKRFNS